ncbi:hypothetical protein [Legionella pneumophila]|uniref:hypothetical protein n=1 Tax=Legionella pneumophila TaxID=446 RepID=UPI00165114DD|nr:hypothetical protein [Legionella pneumophila]
MEVKANGRGLHMGAYGSRQKAILEVLTFSLAHQHQYACHGVAVHGKNINRGY